MRRLIVLLAAVIGASPTIAATDAAGRWEGAAAIPGRSLPMVIDVDRDDAGHWRGSIIVPDLAVDGLPLAHVVATGDRLAFDLGDALGAQAFGAAAFALRIDKPGVATGEFRQGGHVARVSLSRTGVAQVEVPPRSTPLATALVARWSGSFELGGYPREVTIVLARGGDGLGAATFTVVGKKTTVIPVDLVMQSGDYLRLESAATSVSFEGRVVAEAAEIRGTIAMGSIELPLVLRRAGGAT
jgi:hypothetical protein